MVSSTVEAMIVGADPVRGRKVFNGDTGANAVGAVPIMGLHRVGGASTFDATDGTGWVGLSQFKTAGALNKVDLLFPTLWMDSGGKEDYLASGESIGDGRIWVLNQEDKICDRGIVGDVFDRPIWELSEVCVFEKRVGVLDSGKELRFRPGLIGSHGVAIKFIDVHGPAWDTREDNLQPCDSFMESHSVGGIWAEEFDDRGSGKADVSCWRRSG